MEPLPRRLNLSEVLSQNLRLFGTKASTFFGLGVIPAVFACVLFTAILFAFPETGQTPSSGEVPSQFDPLALWHSMSALKKTIVIAWFLASLDLVFRSYAAAVLVTCEWKRQWSIGTVAAFSRVRQRSLWILWFCFFSPMVAGPLAILVGPLIWLAFTPGFPVAVLEGLGFAAALKRGWALVKGNWGRLILAWASYIAMVTCLVVAWVASLSILPPAPVLVRETLFALFLALLLLPSQWFFSFLTLAYLNLAGNSFDEKF